MGTVGPMMRRAMSMIRAASAGQEAMVMATLSAEDGSHLPAVIQLEPEPPREGEAWPEYAARMRERLDPIRLELETRLERPVEPLLAANSLQVRLQPDEVDEVAEAAVAAEVELDPLLHATFMDDAVEDVRLPQFRQTHPGAVGTGVRVAVLDSGIDLHHPFLRVAESVSTCGESVDQPGAHGTHCAGSIASTDTLFPGIAPGVDLLNVKVLLSDGRGQQSFITRGVDAALDLGAQVLSMSLGFNHLPRWSPSGHGWHCPDGRCPLCVAVDNAVALEGVVAVVAAGNEHQRAEVLRLQGHGAMLDTELGCPGQARGAITVGAVTKSTFLPAPFSSRGPTSHATDKPDLVAPGVNITSTVPAPRDVHGQPISNPPRALLFDRFSGTSMATPIVAGAVALLIEQYRAAGTAFTPAQVRHNLLRALGALPFTANEVGGGLLDVSRF